VNTEFEGKGFKVREIKKKKIEIQARKIGNEKNGR